MPWELPWSPSSPVGLCVCPGSSPGLPPPPWVSVCPFPAYSSWYVCWGRTCWRWRVPLVMEPQCHYVLIIWLERESELVKSLCSFCDLPGLTIVSGPNLFLIRIQETLFSETVQHPSRKHCHASPRRAKATLDINSNSFQVQAFSLAMYVVERGTRWAAPLRSLP